MRTGQIGEQLRRTNGWWRDPITWAAEDADLKRARDAAFDYDPAPLADLQPGGLYMLRGPRRVGKTVAVKRAIQRLLESGVRADQIIHAAVDNWRASDLGGLVQQGREVATRTAGALPRYWFIDEITTVKDGWPSIVKNLRDNTEFRNDCVVLTGSSSAGLDDAIKALAGRRGDIDSSDRTLLPMGFGNFCAALGLEVPQPDPIDPSDLLTKHAANIYQELWPWLTELVSTWETYLYVGGFPQAVDDYVRTNTVGSGFTRALWDVIKGEAVNTDRFGDPQLLALLAGLSTRLTSHTSINAIAEEIGAGRDSVARRMRELNFAYITWDCYPQNDAGLPDPGRQPKIYFTDPLFARLASSQGRGREPDHTQLTEQQIGMALARCSERARPGTFSTHATVLHHRTKTKKEVDFIGAPGLKWIPIEGKYVEGSWLREAQTVRSSFGRGLLATRNVLDFESSGSQDVWAVPAPIIAMCLEPDSADHPQRSGVRQQRLI